MDAEEVFHSLRFWRHASVDPTFCGLLKQRNLASLFQQLSSLNFSLWPLMQLDYVDLLTNVCHNDPNTCLSALQRGVSTSDLQPLMLKALLTSHADYVHAVLSLGDVIQDQNLPLSIPSEWIDVDISLLTSSAIALRIPSHLCLNEISDIIFANCSVTNNQVVTAGLDTVSINGASFHIGQTVSFYCNNNKETISGILWSVFANEIWVRNKHGSVMVITLSDLRSGTWLLIIAEKLLQMTENIMIPLRVLAQHQPHLFQRFRVTCQQSLHWGTLMTFCRYIYIDFSSPIVFIGRIAETF
jgi:hypothetical protein